MDVDGRIIKFDIGDITIANIYAQSGTDGGARNSRETMFIEKLSDMLLYMKEYGIVVGDWPC